MDSDSPAFVPTSSICVVRGHEGHLTISAPESAPRPKHLSSSHAGPTRFADVARPLAPKRLRRLNRKSRVLVVDDEPMMCELVGYMLEPKFEVVCLPSGRAALDQLRAGARFDVLLSDLMMPDISGIDLFRALLLEQPSLAKRMIFMTGGTFTDVMDRFLEEVGVDPLMKPFGRDLVYERVDAQLARMI
ncbi:MAG: response regulator [Polyangiales bacterium]